MRAGSQGTRPEAPPRSAAVEIRIEPPDSAAASACLDAYFRELGQRFEGGFELDGSEAAALNDFTPPTGAFLLAYRNAQPIGCVGLKLLDGETAEIKRMWIAASARGQGVARRLLRTLETRARDAGCTRLRLDTNRVLTEAHALYRGEGFVEIERYNDNPHAHHWFEKRL